ncbi:hypothetical protein [Persephonella sp.]
MRNLRVEIPRKLFHIAATLLLLIPLFIFGKWGVAGVSAVMLVVLFPVAYLGLKNRWTAPFWYAIQKLEREENLKVIPGKQAFALAGGMFLASIFFSEEVLLVCIITTAVYDGFATILGLLLGRHRLPTGKSIEGTLGGILFNTVFLLPFMELKWAVFVSAMAGVIENLSSWKRWYLDDNFLLPVILGFILTLLDVPAQLPEFFKPFG